MTTVLGCIADDFTGATDLAGLLARSGHRVSLRIGVPDVPDTDPAPFEVIALKIRTIPRDAATRKALDALAWLRDAGAARFFWKYCSTFDSRPEGNIGPVSEALMAALGADQTVYCPAFPENGRAVFMGNLFVGETPLAESPMKNHPLTPMRDSNLMRLLDPQVARPTGLANRLCVAKGPEILRARFDALRAEGVAHVVADAVANEDLAVIAEACRDMALMTGGSALAEPLPGLLAADGLLPRVAPPTEAPSVSKGAVILSGSCSDMTNRQVALYQSDALAFRLDPLALAENGPGEAIDWLRSQPLERAPLIYATSLPEEVKAAQTKLGAERAGALVEQALADCALAARDLGVGRFVVAGGETSGAVTQALGVSRLDIGPEIAPGVPWCFARLADRPIAITLKSGNFGTETFFTDALTLLEAQ